MSALTQCNHCTLEGMKHRARERGVEIIIVHQTYGEMRGWYSARYSDEDEPVAWFMQLTVGCCC